jgi:hypothetical protein
MGEMVFTPKNKDVILKSKINDTTKKIRFSDTCNVGALIKCPYKGTF